MPILKSKWQLVSKTDTGLPEHGTRVLKHVEDTPLIFICNKHCALVGEIN